MRQHDGFTLVELLIVIVILGILAAVVVPTFTDAAGDARLGSLQTTLQTVRGQIQLYRMQHNEALPTSENTFISQMTQASKADGTTASPGTAGYPFGPYLQSLPNNPYTGSNTVGKGALGSSDWYYEAATGIFRANHDAQYASY